MATAYVQFNDSSESKIISIFYVPQNPDDWPNYAEIEDDDPRYIAYLAEPAAVIARGQRNSMLREIYDVGMSMAQRAVRIASTAEEATYAQGKIAELDAFATALLAVPDQPGFPQTITWPIAPTK